MARNILKRNLFIFVGVLISFLLLVNSCREDDHVEPNFLPSAQVTFNDSIITLDLALGQINATVAGSVKSPVGLNSVKIRYVNKLTATVTDTVLIRDITSFSNDKHYDFRENIEMAGYTTGISVLTMDKNGYTSERILPIELLNRKLAPSFTWLTSEGQENTSIVTNGLTVKKYNTAKYDSAPTLYARATSYNGSVDQKSWGIRYVNVYAVDKNGAERLLENVSWSFDKNPCSGCRYLYQFNFTPYYTEDMVQLKVVVEDLMQQQTKSYIKLKVYEDYAVPNISFDDRELVVDEGVTSSSAFNFYISSEDVMFDKFQYFLVKADGTENLIGEKTSGFAVWNPQPTASDYPTYTITDLTDDAVAFRVKVYNVKGGMAQKDLLIRREPAVDGVRYIRNEVIFSYNERAERPYIYSVGLGKKYRDGDEGIGADIVFHCTNDARLYLLSPSVNGSSGWSPSYKTRITRFLKRNQREFDNATPESLEALKTDLKNKGELTIGSASRSGQSLVGIVRTASVNDGVMSVVEDDNIVNRPMDQWALVKINYDNDSRQSTYESLATREQASEVSIVWAFITNDDEVGLLKIEEAYAIKPGINANAVKLQSQRVTFSIKIANK